LATAHAQKPHNLQPTFEKLGIQLDTRVSQALVRGEPGLAGKLLYSIKQAVGSINQESQASSPAIVKFAVDGSAVRAIVLVKSHIGAAAATMWRQTQDMLRQQQLFVHMRSYAAMLTCGLLAGHKCSLLAKAVAGVFTPIVTAHHSTLRANTGYSI
jgi:hypothetical protein